MEQDPLDESAWQALLQNMEAHGHHARGLQAYEQCSSVFATELGCAPGPVLQALYLRLLRGAHEDDDELRLLIEAVIRLHTARRSGLRSPGHDRGSEGRETSGPRGSTGQAYRALNQLLRTVGARNPHQLA